MKKIALDVGDKTIGVAISDLSATIAQGLETIQRVGIRKDASKIIALVREQDVDTVVVGLPIMLSGDDSIQTEKVREFTALLGNKLRSEGLADINIVFEDERFSTVMAERVLIDADLSREKRKKIIDKQAATVILQSYLDKLR